MNNRLILMPGLTVCIILSGLLGVMPILETHAATKKRSQPSSAPVVTEQQSPTPEQQSPTPEQQALLIKGQLLYDRWCSLAEEMSKKEIKAIGEGIDDIEKDLKYGTISNPKTNRRAEGRERSLDPLRRNVQDAAHDLDLFEIDIKAKYGGVLPTWWQYKGVEQCPKRGYRP